jgi:hypothetical protein
VGLSNIGDFRLMRGKTVVNENKRDLKNVLCKCSTTSRFALRGEEPPKGKSEHRNTQIYNVLV